MMRRLSAEDILRRVLAMRDEYAINALTRPAGQDGFHYGRACGVYGGIDLVAREIAALLEAQDVREKQDEE
jgi:hypothetical protein